MRITITSLLALISLWAGNLQAETFEMGVLETEDLRLLYFEPTETYLAPHAARSFHNSLKFQRDIFDWVPYEETTIALKDFSDYGNAGALASPRNMVLIDIAPASRIMETVPGSERIYMLMNHEMVHVATADGWNQQDRRWRRFFGGKPTATAKHPESVLYSYLTTPRHSSPRWYAEGSAVFMETWMSGGIGRAQGAYDEMVFRSMVRDNAHFYSNLGLVSAGTKSDFQTGTNAYLYGARFLSYLAMEYSPEKVVEWLKRGDDSRRYYASQFKQVFDKPLELAWDEWIEWEHAFQNANLSAVRTTPLTHSEPLVKNALGSISRSYVDEENNTLIGAFRYPGVVAHVGVLSLADGSIDRLTDIKGPMNYLVTSTAFDAKARTLFYTTDNYAYRDLMALDLETGDSRKLIEDGRIGDLVFNQTDRSLWGLRHLNGYVTLVRIPYPYENWIQVKTWPYGQVLYELDISADGEFLSTSMGEVDGKQYLRIFRTDDLLEKKADPIAQFDFGTAVPEGFVFSKDGQYLYGSSYYTGVSNIFRYEVANGDIQAVSNAETGYFRPIPLADGSLIVFEYTGQGFVPVRIDPTPLEDLAAITFLGAEIAAKHPVVRGWTVGSPADIPLDTLTTREGKYRPGREIQFGSGYPVIEGYRDFEAVGWHFVFQDPMLFHSLDVTTTWSWDDDLPSSEKLHASVDYQRLNWRLRYWHNDADFYDLFGPTERSRKGDAFLIGYERTLIYDEPRRLGLSADLNYYTGLDTLPNNQNVQTFFIEDILSLSLGLDYTNTRKSLGAVDHEKGWQWKLGATVDHTKFDTIPGLFGAIDFGFALPWKHSSIWLYNSAGIVDGNRQDPVANFYFGGYGNNYVDDGKVKRYREYNSLPGFEIDEVSGQDFVKSVVEWNLPPIRFEEVGSPGFYLSWARPAIFAGVLTTDPGSSAFERTVSSLGVQLDLNFTVVHRRNMTLSVGYAAGFESGSKLDDEWLVSLKIL